jgi:hypothetical protein
MSGDNRSQALARQQGLHSSLGLPGRDRNVRSNSDVAHRARGTNVCPYGFMSIDGTLMENCAVLSFALQSPSGDGSESLDGSPTA